jgi:hypothetical protein
MGLMSSVMTEVVNNTPNSNQYNEPTCENDWVSIDIGYGFESKREVHDMYMTVKRLGLEEWIKNYSSDKRLNKEVELISNGLEDNNHSGFSFSACLWKTAEVYKNGWYPRYSVANQPS